MGNALEAPVTEKDTVRFARASAAPNKTYPPQRREQQQQQQQHAGDEVDQGGRGERDHRTAGGAGDDRDIPPGGEFSDGIAAASCSMQGWRCAMEDRVCAIMDLQDCPLGVRHVFCLFDGHGGDSVAEYCRMHLTGRLLRCLREAQAKVTATTTSEGTTSEGTSSIAPPPSEGNPSKRPTKGEGRGSGGGGGGTPSKGRETPSERRGGGSKERGVTSKGGTPGGPKGRGGGTPGGGGGGGGRSTQGGVGVGVGASAEASSMIAECVRGACREVDAKVKGRFFTPAGRYVAPRVDDPLDVTPPQRSDHTDAKDFSVDGGTGNVDTMTAHVLEKNSQNARGTPGKQKRNPYTDTVPGDTYEAAAFDEREQAFSTCGSTSLIVLVSDEYIICCNTGDSRAVLASEGASRPLSRDHKPENLQERRRIEAAGGRVEHNRIEGKLAVSRCIGDHPFKSDPTRPLDAQMVVCDPEVTFTVRSDADEFVIMACDGVWDVMGNDQACFFLRKCIQEGARDLGHMLEKMEDACLAKQSMDNMSVLAITFKAAWEEGLHLHKSARFVLEWGCEEVFRWLATNNFGQYQEDFERHEIDGVALLGLTEADLHHKLHLKKVGLRKKLWQKLSPLRLGYLAWDKAELAAWLGHVGLQSFQETFFEADVNGRSLSIMCKADVMSLAKNTDADRVTRRKLYTAVGDLWGSAVGVAADCEWVALHGMLGTRYAGAGSSSGGGGSGPRGGDINGDVWSDPRPFRVSSSSAEPCPSPSSSWASSDDTEDDNADSGGEGIGDAELDRWRRFEGEGDPLGGEIDAPVIVGQGSGLRKGSRSSAVSGARRLSRVLLHKFDAPTPWRPFTPPRSGSIGVGVRGSASKASEGRRFSDSSIPAAAATAAAAAAAATSRLVTRAVPLPDSANPRGPLRRQLTPLSSFTVPKAPPLNRGPDHSSSRSLVSDVLLSGAKPIPTITRLQQYADTAHAEKEPGTDLNRTRLSQTRPGATPRDRTGDEEEGAVRGGNPGGGDKADGWLGNPPAAREKGGGGGCSIC